MKKTLMLIALVVLFAAPAMALNIKTSKHNLGTTGNGGNSYIGNTGTNQICIFCHTPHNAVQNVPLWNRNNPAATGFALYTSSPSLNINTNDRTLSDDSISLFCLSCHDGSGALGARVQNKAGENISGATDEAVGTRTYFQVGNTANGALQNDHPVNFNFDNVAGGGGTRGQDVDIRARTLMSPAGSATAYDGGNLKFFKSSRSSGAYLECATCHDPHGTDNGAGVRIAKFLRKRNDSSSLCLTCHKK